MIPKLQPQFKQSLARKPSPMQMRVQRYDDHPQKKEKPSNGR